MAELALKIEMNSKGVNEVCSALADVFRRLDEGELPFSVGDTTFSDGRLALQIVPTDALKTLAAAMKDAGLFEA
jgi:hypothetical protein